MPLPALCNGGEERKRVRKAIAMGCALLIQTVFAAMISPIFVNWINNENPEGRPMRGSYLVLSMVFMVLICASLISYGYHSWLGFACQGKAGFPNGLLAKSTTCSASFSFRSFFSGCDMQLILGISS